MSSDSVNIVVPMAGMGNRFATAGYTLPKPLIPVRGRPMIEVVIDNLRPSMPHRFIFICQRRHVNEYNLADILSAASHNCEIIEIDGVTEGAACTVLLADKYIDNDQPLMIANCDQYVAAKVDDYFAAMRGGEYDGYIMTMTADDPKWSFVKLNESNDVVAVYEKQVVSDEATVGIYNYAHGKDYVVCANEMIQADDRVNNEFYVAPVYNYLMKQGKRIGYYNIGADRSGMYGLGVPEDLEYFNALNEWP